MQKDIGILTYWGVPNYGACAQAYALQHIMTKRFPDYKTEQIGYLHKKHRKLYYQRKLQGFRLGLLLHPKYYLHLYRHFRNRRLSYPHFEADWQAIAHCDAGTKKQLETLKYDTLITGSDAIWEFSIDDFGPDPHLIGNRLNCSNLVAYACSFGTMNAEDSFPDFVQQGLVNYKSISVRDSNSADIVERMVGKRPPIVLDPTLLWDFQTDTRIPSAPYEKYILVYGRLFSDELIAEVKKYAKENGLQIIGAGIAPQWCDLQLSGIRPLEWIGMFRNAETVVTCTFHGMMFSLNFRKRFLFNQVAYTVNRSQWLLEQLGLAPLFHGDVSLKQVMEYDWDYDSINMRLEKLRAQSLQFLEEAING